MEGTSLTIVAAIAILTVFLSFITALKYAMRSGFARARLIMTLFFCFIVVTLTLSFWRYTLDTLPFTIPALFLGVLAGRLFGVKAAQERLMLQGAEDYMAHFAHVRTSDVKNLKWWSVVNFYSVMGALLLINFVGLSTVIFKDTVGWAIATCVVGAFLLGTIAPYLIHLWSIKAAHASKRITSEA